MKTLSILNDGPYGSECTYNGLRLAGTFSKHEGDKVHVFLIGDATSAAHRSPKVPQGFYNVETMTGNVIRHNGKIGIRRTCTEARATCDSDIADGTRRSTLAELAKWTTWSDKTVVF